MVQAQGNTQWGPGEETEDSEGSLSEDKTISKDVETVMESSSHLTHPQPSDNMSGIIAQLVKEMTVNHPVLCRNKETLEILEDVAKDTDDSKESVFMSKDEPISKGSAQADAKSGLADTDNMDQTLSTDTKDTVGTAQVEEKMSHTHLRKRSIEGPLANFEDKTMETEYSVGRACASISKASWW